MPRTGPMVPYGADQTLYFVVDRLDRRGSVGREAEVERTDLEAVIADLILGRFSDPVRVIAFNTLEHWSQDVSRDIAAEIQTRCDIERETIPEHIQDFVLSHTGRARRSALQRLDRPQA